MKTILKQTLVAAALACTLVFTTTQVEAQEPLGGQPARGVKQSVKDLDEQIAYQGAFEAVLWATPASAIYCFRVGLLEQPGMADNVITAYSGPLTMAQELITPNQVTPYIGAVSDLQRVRSWWKFRPRQTKLFSTVKSSTRGRPRLPMSDRPDSTKAKDQLRPNEKKRRR